MHPCPRTQAGIRGRNGAGRRAPKTQHPLLVMLIECSRVSVPFFKEQNNEEQKFVPGVDTSPYSLDCTASSITIILQDHPGSSRQTLRCFLIVGPRACSCAQNPPRCVSTPPSEKEKPAKGLPSHNWRRGSETRSELSNPTEERG